MRNVECLGGVGMEGGQNENHRHLDLNTMSLINIQIMQRVFEEKNFKCDKKEMDEIIMGERGMVRFSLPTVLGPLNKGQEEP